MNTRYDRQIILPEVGPQGQKNLSQSKILVIGAGGLGGPVLQYLAASGVGHIGICDNDIVSLSNLHRQILFTSKDLGLKKSSVAKNYINNLNEDCSVTEHELRINSQNIEETIKDYQIIIDCTDNFKTKFLIHDACFLFKKKLIQGSIYQFEGQLQCFDFIKSHSAPCLRCLWPKVPDSDCVMNCQEAGVLGVIPGVFGSLQCNEAIKMILNLECLEQGKTLILNLQNLSQRMIRWKKSRDCPLCSKKAHIKETHDSIELTSFEVLERNNQYIEVDLRQETSFKSSQIDSKLKYLFLCQKGIRSFKFVKDLRKQGFKNTFSLFGGADAS